MRPEKDNQENNDKFGEQGLMYMYNKSYKADKATSK